MCDYFHLTGLLERGVKKVIMQEVSATTGLLLLGYLYTGQIEITTQNTQELLAAIEVEEFLCSQTESKNCVSIINLARIYDTKALLAVAKRFEHVKDIFDAEEIHLLQKEDLFEILDADAFQYDNFCFIQNWDNKEFICSTVMGKKLIANLKGFKLIQKAVQTE
ncbi:hypothetical protein CAPTEDRAFT_211281 [Capitella teleta]|uniref:BTB domain-containing protein n=1 Tax=Capitella teleta TaxID=283909 RepID=R7TQ07_CAPTE|nr:hypothetical protein CAPTEDRAFT_211281 [Capitella teleta]|eukprot:ELT93591.1 hypothetical protein CAPTEDRAFT_211281 [Capitella teleta]